MSQPQFDRFFQTVTGNTPYDYQSRLAESDSGTACHSQLINIPTGLGKTAAVVLAWLWNRVQLQNPKWPRRLVYCLPMRTLVEQTRDSVRGWLKSSGDLEWNNVGPHNGKVGVHILMGGEDREGNPWDLYPEENAILIGTQDMLLSRALNRGYGMSRYRWPMHFGLLNNDCLWVMDETQLMGVGLETSVQLAGFRERFGTLAPCVHWWMSATLDNTRLATPEAPSIPDSFGLTEVERTFPEVQQRLTATKCLRPADTQFITPDGANYVALASEIRQAHVAGTLTLVIVNTVERAQELYRALKKHADATTLTLLHSRFRPHERNQLVSRVLKSSGDHLVISTQVVEAGVDLSARTLFTELAPWSSLVQRFGRCHRHGELGASGADVCWLNVPEEEATPYEANDLAAARTLLKQLKDVSLATLANVEPPRMPEPPRHIIRPKDLRELFDTTPDIAGADLDVSRFIRESDDSDCAVFWREGDPAANSDRPTRDELCSVSVARFREFADKQLRSKVWTWDALARQWGHPDRIIPGREYWLDASIGGYDVAVGFDRKSKAAVASVPGDGGDQEAHDDDRGAASSVPESLESHTNAVVAQTENLTAALSFPAPLAATLRQAAVWHDVGKAHEVFQHSIRLANPALATDTLWAKSGSSARLNYVRRRFRHELASALSFRTLAAPTSPHASLIAFLIAAHHGKVRLSLRALPDEREPDGVERLFARGIWDGDSLPPFTLDGQTWPATTLSLASMQIGLGPDGQPSWLEACLELRDSLELGPFRLAFLETILRAADQRASQESHSKQIQPS